jgi:hypothetical protein
LAKVEPPRNDTRRLAVICTVTLFIIDGKERICPVCSAHINLKGGCGDDQ